MLLVKVVTIKNILDANELASAMEGHDAVLSALGSPGFTLFKVTFCQDSIKVIAEAMRKCNIKRFICVGSQYSKRKLEKNFLNN